MKLENEELLAITGGATSGISSTLLNAIARVITTVLDFGRSIGSSISRIKNKNYCN